MTTALLVKDDKLGEIKAQLISTPLEEVKGCRVILHQCDNNWKPINILATSYSEDPEAKLHYELRKEAKVEGTYVEGYSSHVEELNILFDEEE